MNHYLGKIFGEDLWLLKVETNIDANEAMDVAYKTFVIFLMIHCLILLKLTNDRYVKPYPQQLSRHQSHDLEEQSHNLTH